MSQVQFLYPQPIQRVSTAAQCAPLIRAWSLVRIQHALPESRWPEGIRGRRYERRSRRFNSCHRGQLSPRRRTSAPTLRRLVAGVQLTPWRPFAGEACWDVRRFGKAEAGGSNPPSGTRLAVQAQIAMRLPCKQEMRRASRRLGSISPRKH
jgi:hypothetical protein